MRLRLAALCAVALALPVPAGAAPAFKATLMASTHTPKANAYWFYVVSVTDRRGHLVRATVTTQIVDPIGSAHPVEFGCCKINVVNHAFTGVFGDVVQFPPEARGVELTFRVTVKALGGRRVLTYRVTPR